MLALLQISHFALVDELTIEFSRGLNVFTGETGAGKTILIDAIEAAIGGRCAGDVVRSPHTRARIEALFEVHDGFPPAVLAVQEEGQVLLTREISAGGRSTYRINGQLSTAGAVRELAAELIDIHGQHDHQSLLLPARHIRFLDAWGPVEIRRLREELSRRLQELHEAGRRLRSLDENLRERAHKVDLYQYQLHEIEEAGLSREEEEQLQTDASRLAHAGRLMELSHELSAALSGESTAGAADMLAAAHRTALEIAGIDPQAVRLCELIETAAVAAAESAVELRIYTKSIDDDPERLAQVQARQEIYRSLRRKYGDSLAEIETYRTRIAAELEELTGGEGGRTALEERIGALSAEASELAARLHAERSAAAASFEDEIARSLRDLNMAAVRFQVALREPAIPAGAGAPGNTGEAEFLFSANPGEPPRPLAGIASGGELSRVMLALKAALAGSHPLTLIFDEIDAGIGGRTAETLGLKLKELSRSNQVLCITHLPGIASLADLHLQVSKNVTGDRTQVAVAPLDQEARIDELARMLGGAAGTAASHARELLAAASCG